MSQFDVETVYHCGSHRTSSTAHRCQKIPAICFRVVDLYRIMTRIPIVSTDCHQFSIYLDEFVSRPLQKKSIFQYLLVVPTVKLRYNAQILIPLDLCVHSRFSSQTDIPLITLQRVSLEERYNEVSLYYRFYYLLEFMPAIGSHALRRTLKRSPLDMHIVPSLPPTQYNIPLTVATPELLLRLFIEGTAVQ